MKTKSIPLVLLGLMAGCLQASDVCPVVLAQIWTSRTNGAFTHAPHARPAALDSLMAQFKAAPATNRLDAARKIARLMPAVPVIYPHGLIGHWGSFGEDEMIDWNNPSYRLAEDDLIAALGAPDHVRSFKVGGQWNYLSWHAGRDRHHDECGLYIQCYNNYVTGGYVAKTNTVQSLNIRTTGTNSVIVKTNYIE